MTTTKINKLVKKRVNDDLKSRGIKKHTLNVAEYHKELYAMALEMLAEGG